MLRIVAKILKGMMIVLVVLLIVFMCIVFFVIVYNIGGMWGLGILALVLLSIIACAWADWYLSKGDDNAKNIG